MGSHGIGVSAKKGRRGLDEAAEAAAGVDDEYFMQKISGSMESKLN